MAANQTSWIALIWAVLVSFLVSVCDAGKYCYDDDDNFWGGQYCEYGCCGFRDRDCCAGSVGLIVGLCVGAGVLIFIIIIVICVCRRRRYQGFVYRSQAPHAMVVTQSTVTTQGGMVATAGVQPGVTYPPYQPYGQYPNQGYPAASGYPASGYPASPPPQGYGYPPQPMNYAAAPPSYDSLQPAAGGVTNQGFDNK